MAFITAAGAKVYKDSTDVAYHISLLSWDQLIERYRALRLLSEPSTTAFVAVDRLLRLEDEQREEDDWPQGEPERRDRTADSEGVWGGTKERDGGEDDDVVLHYIPGGRTGLMDWQFHPYDPDFFPSVPHGHHRHKRKTKLDPYLGFMYQYSKQVGREPRWKIIELWNDQQFRDVASMAINYYLTNYPTYRGWRVVNPRKLPRRRYP